MNDRGREQRTRKRAEKAERAAFRVDAGKRGEEGNAGDKRVSRSAGALLSHCLHNIYARYNCLRHQLYILLMSDYTSQSSSMLCTKVVELSLYLNCDQTMSNPFHEYITL